MDGSTNLKGGDGLVKLQSDVFMDRKNQKSECPGHQKKRKIDADGFVKPNTPDMAHFSLCTDLFDQEQSEERNILDDSGIGADGDANAVSENPIIDIPSEGKDSNKPIADVVKELGQESKALFNTWTQVFTDSENFELLCPARLDRLLEEAKALEKSLLEQKDILFGRLKAISKTLENP